MATTPTPKPGESTDPTPPATPPAPPATQIKTFTQDEVNEMVTKARRDEKTKLYSDIENAKKRANELESSLQTKEAELEGLRSTSTEAQNLRADIEKLRAEAAAQTRKTETLLDEALERQRAEYDKRLAQIQLDSYRKQLIAGAAGAVIPELVTGSTEAEIEASFNASKARYAALQADIEAKLRHDHEKSMRDALPPSQAAGAGGNNDTAAGSSLGDWRKLSPADWEAQKRRIKEEAFKKAGLPLS